MAGIWCASDMTQDETRAANKKKNAPVLILFFYLVKKNSTTGKSAGSWSLTFCNQKFKTFNGPRASLAWYKGILICSHSRARSERLIAKHYRAFWLAQEEKGPKLRARGIVYLALGFERKLHFLTQRRSEKTSSINKLESICNWTVSTWQKESIWQGDDRYMRVPSLTAVKCTVSFKFRVFFFLIRLFFSFRQASKPLLERQRRARINRSLEELKGLVLSALYRDVSCFTKLSWILQQVVLVNANNLL